MKQPNPPQLSRQLRACVSFARFCANEQQDPLDVAHLVALARKAFRAGERACAFPDRDGAERQAGERFEAKAKALGYEVQWPGLWPTLLKNGLNVYLPEV